MFLHANDAFMFATMELVQHRKWDLIQSKLRSDTIVK